MKKIIHMSDLHIGWRDFNKRFLSVAKHLKKEVEGKTSQYIVVITGDLVHNASKKDAYKEAKRGIRYLQRLGFKDVLVVPGNHDYGNGRMGNRKFVKNFKEVYFGRQIDYPKKDIVGGIAFVGLDSMAEELNWYDKIWAEGELGKEQLKRLKEILNEKDVRGCKKRVIYLHHHPFKWRPFHQLRDSRTLKKVLMQTMESGISIDALLFGHNHEGYEHNGTWGIERCYDAGTVTLKPRPKVINWYPWFQVRSSTRIIDLSKKPELDQVLPFGIK